MARVPNDPALIDDLPDGLDITVMGPEVVDLIHTLHRQCFDNGSGEYWARDHFLQTLDRRLAPAMILSVRRSDGGLEPVGYAFVRLAVDEAEVLSFAILPDFRKRGLGIVLLRQLKAWCQAAGFVRLFLEVRADNAAAQNLYRRASFIPVGLRPKYYLLGDGTRIDAVTMACNLS